MGTGSWEAVDMAIPSTSVGSGSAGEVDITMNLGPVLFTSFAFFASFALFPSLGFTFDDGWEWILMQPELEGA